MKTKPLLLLLTAMVASVLAAGSAQAGLLITYNNGTSLGLFDDGGSLIRNYSTTLTGGKAVAVDNSGNVYVGDGGLIAMYDIASGSFVRNLASLAYNDVRALAFDLTKPGQIVTIDNYGASDSEMVAWNTDGLGAATSRGPLGNNYTGLAYFAGDGYLYAPSDGGFVEAFLSGPGFTPAVVAQSGLGTTGGATATSGDIYYVRRGDGSILRQVGGTTIITGLNNPIGITNDGSNLFIAENGGNKISIFATTGGSELSNFTLSQPVAIAYTAVPEPGVTSLLVGLGVVAILFFRKRTSVSR